MKKKNIRAAAAIVAAALLSSMLAGCSLFRPIDGSAADTDSGMTAETKAPDITQPKETTDTDRETQPTPPVTSAQTTEAITTAPPTPAEKKVSILAVGDNIIHEAVYVDAKNRATDGEEYNFLPMYSGIAERVKAADIAFVNHESPLAGAEYGISGYPTFNSPQEAGSALNEIGFDIINLANNHILDKRTAGARATVEFVRTLDATALGVYLDQTDYENIRVTEVNGIRISWLSFCYGSNNPNTPAAGSVVMPLLDDDAEIRDRIHAAGEISDFVVVSAHWGVDGQAAITQEQRRMAKIMVEAGADVILGHHPHILQSVEWLTSSSGDKTLVAYSLGNFLSAQLNAENMIGGMLQFDVVMDEKGQCTLESPVMEITVNHYDGNKDESQDYGVHRFGMQLYMLEDYSDTLASKHGCRFFSSGFSMKWIEDHVRSIIAEEFLPPCLE